MHPGVLAKLASFGALRKELKILEVGCGTGNYAVALRVLLDCEIWAIDPSQEMLSIARERSAEIHFSVGRGEKLDFPRSFFDTVFSVDVIHHLSRPRDFFCEAHRVLKEGGNVCTVTDSEWIIRHREPLAVYFPETVEVELKRYPRIDQLKRIMIEVGFSDIKDNMAEFPYELHDAQAYRYKAFSSLHLISEEGFERGIKQMELDLLAGPIKCVSRYSILSGTKPSQIIVST